MKEYDDGQFWRDEEGRWHDWQDRVYERKRDALADHAYRCGCSSCVNRYENYMRRVVDDEATKYFVVAYMNALYWLIRGYTQDDLEVFDDGSVFPVKKILDHFEDDDDFGQDVGDDGLERLL
jgi:hypothetical protein